mmetsp:Transcript_73794/g.213553  ORF Transcript_73794/g.213553 Transcript_73794/m.213553 type:complete len:228 (+) Transcript_73794:465-1148(+)
MSRSPSKVMISSKLPAARRCSSTNNWTLGFGANFRDLAKHCSRSLVACNKAQCSWTESPAEIMLTCWSADKPWQKAVTSARKAQIFQSVGDRRPVGSKAERAEKTSTSATTAASEGRRRKQLSCTQPATALVTITTLPCIMAFVKVAATESASLLMSLRWDSVNELRSSANRSPRCANQLVGNNVSSQSKMISESCSSSSEQARSLPGSVERSSNLWSSAGTTGSTC